MTAVDALDNREVQVLNAMFLPSSGGTNNELVAATSYTLKQVKEAIASIKRKLGTNNRFHSAAIFAAATRIQTNMQS
jgi:DNA-binding CsgD family transcriptional regulator